jgi:hypothetical protein
MLAQLRFNCSWKYSYVRLPYFDISVRKLVVINCINLMTDFIGTSIYIYIYIFMRIERD